MKDSVAPPKSSAAWYRAYDRAVMRGDYDRVAQMIAMSYAERAVYGKDKS